MAHLPNQLTSRRVIAILGITVAGTLIVLAGLVAMNRISHAPDEDEVENTVSFSVPTPPPPPPRERQRPETQQRRSSARQNLAPLPNLGSSLSGIQVSLPEFEADAAQVIGDSLLGELDDVALTEDTVDEPPTFRTRVVPEYPERARQREIEGQVIVSALIGTGGQVQAMQILESTPPGIFDEAVRTALSASTFQPATYRGAPVETWVEIPFPFNLN